MGKSKHNKGSWREVDIKDVDDFLSDQRLQERLGINFASKADDELFVVDTEPLSKEELEKKDRKELIRLTRLQKKQKLLTETPKCFQSLVNVSKVPDPISKRNHTKPVTLSKHTLEKKIKKNILRQSVKRSNDDRTRTREEKKKARMCRTEFAKDLWTDEPQASKLFKPNEWFTKETILCNTLKVKAKKPKKLMPKAPPVVIPRPGESYNPSLKEHQELMQDVVSTELKVIKEEKHLQRVTSAMFRKVNAAQLQKEHLEQLKEGLNNDTVISDDDGVEYKPINPPVVNKKKDLKTRRHIKLENELKLKAKMEAIEKKKLADIYKLRFMKQSINKQEAVQESRKLKRTVKKVTEVKAPQICSRKFTESDPILVPMEELSGNLRNIMPKGGGLTEHFTSLQRRGMASMSKVRLFKKAATKRYKLASHRMPWEIFERPVKKTKQTK